MGQSESADFLLSKIAEEEAFGPRCHAAFSDALRVFTEDIRCVTTALHSGTHSTAEHEFSVALGEFVRYALHLTHGSVSVDPPCQARDLAVLVRGLLRWADDNGLRYRRSMDVRSGSIVARIIHSCTPKNQPVFVEHDEYEEEADFLLTLRRFYTDMRQHTKPSHQGAAPVLASDSSPTSALVPPDGALPHLHGVAPSRAPFADPPSVVALALLDAGPVLPAGY